MKTALLPVCLLALLALGAAALQEMPEMPMPAERLPQHEWLQQLVGEWTCTTEASMGEGDPPMTMESKESVRSIGGLWIQAEGSADFMGTPFTSLLTLGYDPERETFVGTWIDTMHAHLWAYTGELDESRTTLTLHTEGPSFDDPSTTSRYRETLEIVSPDHKVFTSSVQQDDGTFKEFLRAEYRRKE